MTKVTLKKLNNKNDKIFNNHAILIDGYRIGIIGQPFKNADYIVFYSESCEAEKFNLKEFKNNNDAIQFFEAA